MTIDLDFLITQPEGGDEESPHPHGACYYQLTVDDDGKGDYQEKSTWETLSAFTGTTNPKMT
jgi:hypothetical protein